MREQVREPIGMNERPRTWTFEEWVEVHDEELWAEYHEHGACYDQDYETWLERRFQAWLHCRRRHA